ncbi:protease PrsW [Actinomyces sp. Z5]|uniref:protease PrsW n=1 Tax=Actinomyces sp. Z5 TaxID=2250216 RepID=UPI0011BF5BE3|nr:protease PrsW [Actinomyces sp. Z5]
MLDVPAEWWERSLEGWWGWWAHHAGFARAVVRAQRVVSTVALVLGVIALAVVPRLALGLVPTLFMTGCLLIIGLVSRTRTMGLRPLLLLMGISVPWSGLVAAATRAIGEAIGLSTTDDGARIALAAFVEEPGKLLPLLALALLAPGRIRRLAAVDWALLGFAAGAGFIIAEDGARRLVPPGIIAQLLGEDRIPVLAEPVDGRQVPDTWGQLGREPAGAGHPGGGDDHRAPDPHHGGGHGHRPGPCPMAHPPPLVARRSLAAARGDADTTAIVDHACYNAAVGWTDWADQDTAIPTWIRLTWQALGQGHTQIHISVALFITCMLVDAHRRHRAGVVGDVAIEAPKTPGLAMVGAPALRVPVQALVWLAAYAWSDLVIVWTAYGDRSLPRRWRMAEGRAMGEQVRGVRQDAMTVTTPDTESAARNTFRIISLAVGAVMLTACLWYGTRLVQDIGTWLQQPDWPYFFAGLLDGLAKWWDSLGLLGQILVTALAVLLLAWAGLSVTAALGAVGVGTWALAHGRGIATFLQDPAAATRSYATNVTWEQLLLDGVDFALTFIPGSALGLGTRAAARTTAESLALTRAARREITGLTEVNNLFAQRDAAKAARQAAEKRLKDAIPPGYDMSAFSTKKRDDAHTVGGRRLQRRPNQDASSCRRASYEGAFYGAAYCRVHRRTGRGAGTCAPRVRHPGLLPLHRSRHARSRQEPSGRHGGEARQQRDRLPRVQGRHGDGVHQTGPDTVRGHDRAGHPAICA